MSKQDNRAKQAHRASRYSTPRWDFMNTDCAGGTWYRAVGKVAYSTREIAKAAAARTVKLGRGRMVAYKCDTCGHWHTGHPRETLT